MEEEPGCRRLDKGDGRAEVGVSSPGALPSSAIESAPLALWSTGHSSWMSMIKDLSPWVAGSTTDSALLINHELLKGKTCP